MEQNRSVDVLIPTYKPDQKCVQLAQTSSEAECGSSSDLSDRYGYWHFPGGVIWDFRQSFDPSDLAGSI